MTGDQGTRRCVICSLSMLVLVGPTVERKRHRLREQLSVRVNASDERMVEQLVRVSAAIRRPDVRAACAVQRPEELLHRAAVADWVDCCWRVRRCRVAAGRCAAPEAAGSPRKRRGQPQRPAVDGVPAPKHRP